MRRFMLFIIVVAYVVTILVIGNPLPGTKRVRHRIYVPHKIHTVYVTKFVKVPEHHHHHHYAKKQHHHYQQHDDVEGGYDESFQHDRVLLNLKKSRTDEDIE